MIEEKKVKNKDKELIGTLEHFGWKRNSSHKDNTKSMTVFYRDTEMPYYKEIVHIEEQYNEIYKEVIPTYTLITPLFVFLTLMLIIPGLIYKIVVNNHNARIEEHNQLIYDKMEEILDKANNYASIK